jgi:YidC/Oxa1 family membrane protein insertase
MADIFYTVIIYPITQILEFTFLLSQTLFRDSGISVSGISVVFISITISVLCLPLYAVAEKWQRLERNIWSKLKPKANKIKKVFKGDEQYLILSTYYRQNHYHPIYALCGSFGLLIQIPFFIAAYLYLSRLEIIKNVPFLFIKDLGSPDALFSTGGFKVNFLPVAMTMINCFACAIYVKGLPLKDKIQLYGMAGIFLILLYNSPSALVLYWTMNNIFSVGKNIFYRIQNKYKHHLLLVLFSASFILLAVFCIVKYSYISKARYLTSVCFFTAFIPWVFVVFNKQIIRIINIKYEFTKSLAVFLTSIFMIWALIGLFIPSQLVVSSPQEFSFIDNYASPLFFLFNTAIQSFGFFIFWPVCLYFLFSSNIKKIFSVVSLAVSIGILVNIFLFSGNYGLISINLVYDASPDHSVGEILFNLCILLIPLAASFILYMLKNKNIILIPVSLCVFSILTISVVNILKINASFNELKTYYVNEQKETREVSPVFSLSQTGKNIVVIMLDRATSVFMPFIFEESPELKEVYSGFTFYSNTVSFGGYTFMGAPPVYGGYDYTPEEINNRINIPLVEKQNQSLIMLPRIFCENGFSVCVTDSPYSNYNWKGDLSIFDNYRIGLNGGNIKTYITDSQYTDLWLMEHNLKLPKTGDIIKRNMFWYSLVKGLPLLFRLPLYMNGSWCSPDSSQRLRLTLNGYAVLDYLSRLTEITDNDINTALVMTNNATHEGSFLQAPEYSPVTTVTNFGNSRFAKEHSYHINAAAIKRIAVWFDFLKKENVYDNTRIILVSDHGPQSNFITKIGLPFNVDQFNPLLMVKDFNASGEIKTDMTFMSNADVPYLSLVDIIENPKNPFTGNEISMEQKKKPLYIAISGSFQITGKNYSQYRLDPKIDYFVHDNIFTAENWIPASEKK